MILDRLGLAAPPWAVSVHFAFGVFACLWLLHLFWSVWKSPLRTVPGPIYTLFSPVVLRWHEFHGRRTRYVHTLHRRYGPVVRLAPDEVAFASASAVKDIYGTAGSGFDKTDFYDLFQVYGRRTMFATLVKDDHARRRRLLADRYANSNVLKPTVLAGIQERAGVFVDRCRNASDGVVDIYIALHAYAFDCVTHHLFHPHGADSLRNETDAEIMREVTFDDSLHNRLLGYRAPVLHAIIGRVLALFAKPRETPLANDFVMEASARRDAAPFTLLDRMNEKQKSRNEDAEKIAASFDSLDAAAESADHMAAGIETTGDALCFLMWELSQPRSVRFQERLRAELRTASPDTHFDQLPFLDAVIQEGLRCFPAIPMSLPRVIPGKGWGGCHQKSQSSASNEGRLEGRTVDGFFLPAGTVVSSQAFSVHRLDTTVFPDPDTFNPDRWLASDGDADRRRLFFAFASGGRGCIGKHLALAEMKLLLRGIYSEFSTEPGPNMTDADMAMSDQLISTRPVSQRCNLKFVPLAQSEQ